MHDDTVSIALEMNFLKIILITQIGLILLLSSLSLPLLAQPPAISGNNADPPRLAATALLPLSKLSLRNSEFSAQNSLSSHLTLKNNRALLSSVEGREARGSVFLFEVDTQGQWQ